MKGEVEEILLRNLDYVRERIALACSKVGRKPEDIRILGASKKQSPEKIRFLYNHGITLFGENYVQEAEEKITALEDLSIEWHFIGRLQTNKVKRAIRLFHMIETVDRKELAFELEKRLSRENKVMPILIEVNIGGEPTKGGIRVEELESFCEVIQQLKHLEVRGLMCLPPLEEDPNQVRPYFVKMRELFEKFKPFFGESFRELSMGTSHDFEVAIEEGATIIRLGSILFGPRL